ncbi:MAG: hypothetical protein P8J20_04455 [Novosphingobium sp.]|nr:hypothetical protein [Novosphingobium sp.]
MTADETSLPDGFEALERFVATWAIADLAERDAMRGSSTPDQRKAFYSVASGLLEPALDYLDGKPLTALSDPEQRLMNLMLSLAHVALAQEVQHEDEAHHAHFRSFLPFTPKA